MESDGEEYFSMDDSLSEDEQISGRHHDVGLTVGEEVPEEADMVHLDVPGTT